MNNNFEDKMLNVGIVVVFILLVMTIIMLFIGLGVTLFTPEEPKVKDIEITEVERTNSGELITLDIDGQLHDYYYEY